MNIDNFTLSIVGIIVGLWIESVPHSPKEGGDQLFQICMNSTARNFCAYCVIDNPPISVNPSHPQLTQ